MLQVVDLEDGLPMFHQIGGQQFVVMSHKRYMELFHAEMERDTLKSILEKQKVRA